ncbi:MAG: hypothetical protein ACR5LD_01520 [Symbiopectobacterium sp.]
MLAIGGVHLEQPAGIRDHTAKQDLISGKRRLRNLRLRKLIELLASKVSEG